LSFADIFHLLQARGTPYSGSDATTLEKETLEHYALQMGF
jgi:hypothetical protein